MAVETNAPTKQTKQTNNKRGKRTKQKTPKQTKNQATNPTNQSPGHDKAHSQPLANHKGETKAQKVLSTARTRHRRSNAIALPKVKTGLGSFTKCSRKAQEALHRCVFASLIFAPLQSIQSKEKAEPGGPLKRGSGILSRIS